MNERRKILLIQCLGFLIIIVILIIIVQIEKQIRVGEAETYCSEFIKFNKKMQKTNPEIKFPDKSMNECKKAYISLTKNDPRIKIWLNKNLKCMKTSNNYEEYFQCSFNK